MLVEELAEFAGCVRGERFPETGAAEGLAALEVILGALHSAESGQVYTLQATGSLHSPFPSREDLNHR
jgi:hypothetical protein